MLFNIDEKQLMLELKNKDERALKICMNKYYRYSREYYWKCFAI